MLTAGSDRVSAQYRQLCPRYPVRLKVSGCERCTTVIGGMLYWQGAGTDSDTALWNALQVADWIAPARTQLQLAATYICDLPVTQP